MEYKRVKRKNYIYNITNTDRFKTNLISFSFIKELNKKDIPYFYLLSYLLVYTSKKYPTTLELSRKLEDLYACNIFSNVSNIGKIMFLETEIEYINSRYTEKTIDKETIDLLLELIFNPHVKNNEFDEKAFNYAKINMIEKLKSIKEDPVSYGNIEFRKLLFKGTETENILGEIEDYENITSKDLYNFYSSLIKENLIIGIIGDFKEEEIIKYIDKKLEKQETKSLNNIDIYNDSKIKKQVLTKEISSNFNQSHLFIGYKFKDLTDFEKHYVINIYSLIFGGDASSLLFKIVREQNGLCYSIYSTANRFSNTLRVYAGINKNDYQKCVDLIKQCKEKMNDEAYIEKLILNAKNTLYTSVNTLYDDMSGIEQTGFLKNFENIDSVEAKKEKIKSITTSDVINLNQKIYLDTIFHLKGDNL